MAQNAKLELKSLKDSLLKLKVTIRMSYPTCKPILERNLFKVFQLKMKKIRKFRKVPIRTTVRAGDAIKKVERKNRIKHKIIAICSL